MRPKAELKPLFLERMRNLLPNDEDYYKYIESLKRGLVNSIRVNTLKISVEELKKRLVSKNWIIEQPFKDYPEIIIVKGKFSNDENVNNKINSEINNDGVVNHIKNSLGRVGEQFHETKLQNSQRGKLRIGKEIIELEPGELGRSLEHLLGYYYIQEIASMLPVLALKPKAGELVLDIAAAPGSKTTQIAATMKNQGTIIANEISLKRIKILASNLERCGVTNVVITRKEGVAFCNRMKKAGFQFDKILVDAPCSGEGTIRSSPKTALMWNPNTIRTMSKIQKQLVSAALEILKPKGELVYSTCTHAPEENEEVVDFVLKNFDNVKIDSISLPIKCRPGLTGWIDDIYGNEVSNSCRIYPQDNDTEGFFIAKLRKTR